MSARVVREGALEQLEREPARLEVRFAEQAIGDEQQGRGAVARVAVRKPRATAAISGQRTPWTARSRGRHAAGPRGSPGPRGRRSRREAPRRSASGSGCAPRARPEARPPAWRRDEGDGAGGDSLRAPAGAVAIGGHHGRVHAAGRIAGRRRTGRAARSVAESRLARLVGGDVDACRRSRARRRSRRRRSEPAVSTTAVATSVIQPSARIGWPTGTGRRKSTVRRAVMPQLSRPTSAQAMTSSRIVPRSRRGRSLPALESRRRA